MQNTIATQTTNLIPVIDIVINGIPMKGCNARDLHAFLGNGDEFANWIKDRICQYDFQENQDYVLILANSQIKKGRGGDRKSKDYHITLGMAKELAMVERNEQGKAARKYFIECEKQLLESKGQLVPHNYIETITAAEQQILQEIVAAKTQGYGDLVGKARAEVWSRVHRKFRISKYEQLPRTQITDCILYINQMELHLHPTPNDKHITDAQYVQLLTEIDKALIGWCWTTSDRDKIMNNIRLVFNIQNIRDLKQSQVTNALTLISQYKTVAFQCLCVIGDLKDYMVKEIIMGGQPLTGTIVKEYRQKIGELPNPINWKLMQQQLLTA